MGRWDDALQRVDQLNASVKPDDAQVLLTSIINDCSDDELGQVGLRFDASVARFLPKRKRVLEEVLKARRSRAGAVAGVPSPKVGDVKVAEAPPSPLSKRLAHIVQLNRAVQPALAETEFRELLKSLTKDEISLNLAGLRSSVESFLPKRRRLLQEQLDKALNAVVPIDALAPPVQETSNPASEVLGPRQAPKPADFRIRAVPQVQDVPRPRPRSNLPVMPLAYSRDRLSRDLEDLGSKHIFQWSTFYRDTLSRYFDAVLEEIESCERPAAWLNLMKASLSHHATAIFQRGYRYQLENNLARPHYAITKSLAGLQRFLDLPIEFYSARLTESHHANGARHLRQLCSAMASGILIGYSNAKLDQVGGRVLPRFSGSWMHVLPFLTSDDLRELMSSLQPGVILDGIQDSVQPFVRALDLLLTRDPDVAPLPVLSQYSEGIRRLEVSLQPPLKAMGARRIEVLCYLDERFVDRLLIEEAAGRAVGAVIAPLRADLRVELLGAERLSDIVVPTGGIGEEAHTRLVALLDDLLYETTSTSGSRPVDYNYAATFPLENPFLTRYSHVYRTSVRSLMQSFEQRNGVRLWCSVRRSGKTTACASDIGSTSAQSSVVAQTCDSTGQIGGLLYKRIQEALDSGRRLSDDFVTRTVSECQDSAPDTRVVLVLDEYETLFGALRTSLEQSPGLRYTVVQPLLNQLVAFTRDNLLIFVGQRPDAHWILTDQNQLSPVVTQDPFPLFVHGPAASGSVSEFQELVQKMMSGHVALEPGFVDQVFGETGGHPFLTGKLLVSFWDWLIDNQRPKSSLAPVRPDLFMEFADSCLGHSSIAHNHRYEMFRRAAADHLSPLGRTTEPWLHSVYSVMRVLVLSSPTNFSVPLGQFIELAERTSDLVPPEDLLSTATRANFLVHEGGQVRPRIPLLGRIAAAVQPR